jgi:hypothetical protein
MSRSYKKHLWFKDHNSGAKREANRVVRKTSEIANGNAYRKVYDSYNICDFKILHDPNPRWYEEWVDPISFWKARMK